MNVIANSRPVRRWVLIAKDRNVLFLSLCHRQEIGNEMSLRFVMFPKLCRGAGRIKIPERDKLESKRAVKRLKNLFHDQLGPSIRIGGTLRVLLVDRNLRGFSVSGAGGRENK